MRSHSDREREPEEAGAAGSVASISNPARKGAVT